MVNDCYDVVDDLIVDIVMDHKTTPNSAHEPKPKPLVLSVLEH